MRTWLVAISLVLGAMSGDEVCYFTTDSVYYNARFGQLRASYSGAAELKSDNMPQSSAEFLDRNIYANRGETFTYDLFSYGLAIQPNSDLVFAASTKDILTLTVQGLDLLDLQEIYKTSFSTTGDRVSRKQNCLSAESDIYSDGMPFDQVTKDQALQWRFTLTDGGVGKGGSFKTEIEDVANLGTVLGTQDDTLMEPCMIFFREKKGKLVVNIGITSASYQYLEIVTGHESDSVPKVDGMVPLSGGDMAPVIDFQYYKEISSNTRDPAVMVFEYGAGACVDITNYSWTDGYFTPSAKDQCPSRAVLCKYPAPGDAANSATCAESDYCKWCTSQCLATKYLTCSAANLLQDLSSNTDTKVVVGDVPITSSNREQYNKLFLGERLTISCINSATHLLEYKGGTDQDDYSQISIDCMVNIDGEVTDFDKMVVTCKPKCTTVTYDAASVVLSIDIANIAYPHGFPFSINCVDGYSDQSGYTTDVYQVACNDGSDISAKKCFRCEIDTIDPNAHATYYDDKNNIFTGDSILPNKELTLKCADGYSTGDASKVKQIKATCLVTAGVAALDDVTFTSTKCKEDCTLNFDQDPHGLVFEFAGKETDHESVPAGLTYDVSCKDPTKKLQFGQSTTINCDTIREITVKGCRDTCIIADLFVARKRYVYTKVDPTVDFKLLQDTNKDTPVAYGTPISLQCNQNNDYAFAFEAPNEKTLFSCNDKTYEWSTPALAIVANTCYVYCELGTNIDNYADKPTSVLKGDDQMLQTSLSDLKLDPSTSVRITCKNPDATVGSSPNNYVDVVCPLGNDKKIDLDACRAACLLSNLKTPTTNTKVGHLTDNQATKIPYNEKAKLYCESNEYEIGSTSTMEDTTYLECGVQDTDGRFKYRKSDNTGYDYYVAGKETVAKEFSCLPLPQFPANQKTATGPMKMTIQVTLPQTVDKALVIAEIVIISGASKDLCKILNPDISTTFTVFSCVYTETDPAQLAGGILDISAKVTYTKPDMGTMAYPKIKINVAYAGPPKVSNELTNKVSAIGDVAVIIVDMDVIKTAYGPLDTADYQLQFEVNLIDENGVVKASLPAVDYTTFVATTKWEPFGSFKLQPTTKYSLGVKTYLKGYDGADFAAPFTFFPFETGRTMPSLEVSGTTTTTATLTVTAAEAGSVDLNYHVKEFVTKTIVVDGATESIVFTNGKATLSLTGLKALTKYTIDARLVSESTQGNSLYSKEATVDFTQGPDQPDVATTDTWTKTDDAVTVSWQSIKEYTYYLKLFEKQEDDTYPTDPVAEFIYPVPDKAGNNGRKKRADELTVSHTFESLKPHGSYKLTMVTEVDVGPGETVKSASLAMVFQLYACSKADKTAGGLTIKHKASEDAIPDYLKADSNALFVITCPDKEQFKQDTGGVVDSETSCEAGGWSAHSACESIPGPTEPPSEVGVGAIVGIIVAVLVILLAVVLIVFLWRRRGNDTGSSRKYSPRDEEKQNEPEDQAKKPLELTAVVTENEYDTVQEAPDIPANGDNVSMASQEKKIALDDDEDNADVVIDNKAASATEQV